MLSRSQVPHSPRPRNSCLVSLIFGISKLICRRRERVVCQRALTCRGSLCLPPTRSLKVPSTKSPDESLSIGGFSQYVLLTQITHSKTLHKGKVWLHQQALLYLNHKCLESFAMKYTITAVLVPGKFKLHVYIARVYLIQFSFYKCVWVGFYNCITYQIFLDQAPVHRRYIF